MYYVLKKLDGRMNRIHVAVKMKMLAEQKAQYAKKRLKMIEGYKGNPKEYKEVVLKYWEKYGVKPKKYWFTLYNSGKDSYDPRYIPDTMWYKTILPYFNDIIMRRAYTDKAMYSRLFVDVKKPETIVKNIFGYFYNGDGDKIISRDDAIKICENEKHLIIKPSVNSGRGKSIVFYDQDDSNSLSITSIFDKFGNNFVVQRFVKQHAELSKINPTSLNTIRVVSFRFKGEIHILSTILRMGGKGSRIDNISAGGISCRIQPDGWLAEKSVTRKSEWTDHHPNGIKFKDIKIPFFDDVIKTVKRLHLELPYFNIVGWDIAVGEDGSPVMIEFNVMPEPNQISCGPTFGELTDEVLDEVFMNEKIGEIKNENSQ